MVVVQWLTLCPSTTGGCGFKSLVGDLKKKKDNFWSFSFYKENFDLKVMAMFFENKSPGFRLLNLFSILHEDF